MNKPCAAYPKGNPGEGLLTLKHIEMSQRNERNKIEFFLAFAIRPENKNDGARSQPVRAGNP